MTATRRAVLRAARSSRHPWTTLGRRGLREQRRRSRAAAHRPGVRAQTAMSTVRPLSSSAESRFGTPTSHHPPRPIPVKVTVTEPREALGAPKFSRIGWNQASPLRRPNSSMDFLRAARLPAPPIDVRTVVLERPPELPKPTPVNPSGAAAADRDDRRDGGHDGDVLHVRSYASRATPRTCSSRR